MAINYFCPKWYSHHHLKDEEINKINLLFDDYINNLKNFENPKNWECNVKSSLYLDSNEDEIWRNLFTIFQPYLIELIKESCFQKEIKVYPVEMWVNKYDRGDFQEYHDHCSRDSNLSMVYFHQLNEDDGCKFQFYNDMHQLYKLSGLDNIFNLDGISHAFVPNISRGSIIFFPSNYIHSVSLHKGSKTRITFSANLNCI